MLVSIIIPCFNLLYQTKDCLEALAKNVDYPFEVIVINNNSTDETKEYLNNEAENILKQNKLFNKLIIKHNSENKYLAGAINIGVKQSIGEYISVIANDIIIPENMYKFLIDKLEEDYSIGAIGPWYTENTDALKLNPNRLESILYYLELKNNQSNEIKTNWHFSVCHIMRKDVWNKVGCWDENLRTHCNDNDWGIRLELAGYKAITYKQYVCYHHYGSLARKQIHGESIVAKNDTRYFHNKWGIYSHQKINEISNEIKEKAMKGNYLL